MGMRGMVLKYYKTLYFKTELRLIFHENYFSLFVRQDNTRVQIQFKGYDFMNNKLNQLKHLVRT